MNYEGYHRLMQPDEPLGWPLLSNIESERIGRPTSDILDGGKDVILLADWEHVDDQSFPCHCITDLYMPGMTGLSLIELLRARHCKIPRLAIMSAVGGEFLPLMAGAGCAYFEKPFELSDLLSWLRQEDPSVH